MADRKARWIGRLLMVAMAAAVLAGCNLFRPAEVPLTAAPEGQGSPTSVPTERIIPTPAPPPPTTLIVCLRDEPETLYSYGLTSHETDIILEAIYDGPIDLRSYSASPVILQSLPDLEAGTAWIEEVTVALGEVYLNPDTRQPENLALGQPYLPAGCGSSACIENYWGRTVTMLRMVAEFKILPGLKWSDGEALTASDSVFSFWVDRQSETPTSKYLTDRTYDYQALDEVTLRWTGIPGFLDSEYMTNFWSPLPEHLYGQYKAGELPELEMAARSPVGWGAYAIEEWQAGVQIILRANPHYHRAAEGLPAFERLVFRFVGAIPTESALQQLITGECDLIDEALIDLGAIPKLLELSQGGQVEFAWVPGPLMERLELNAAPADRSQARYFADERTRQGLALCLDRSQLVEELLAGMSELTDSYLPARHPLYHSASAFSAPDLDRAAGLLTAAGWVDHDGTPSTPRVAQWVEGAAPGTELVVRYATLDDPFHQQLAEHLQADLGRCGVRLQVEAYSPAELLAPWPQGVVFGRSYQIASWAWPVLLNPSCEMFHSEEIPSDEHPFGINASAYRSWEYDQACLRAYYENPANPAYQTSIRRTQELFSSQLPAIPLFQRPRLLAMRPDICQVEVDPTTLSMLYGIEGYNRSESCAD